MSEKPLPARRCSGTVQEIAAVFVCTFCLLVFRTSLSDQTAFFLKVEIVLGCCGYRIACVLEALRTWPGKDSSGNPSNSMCVESLQEAAGCAWLLTLSWTAAAVTC